MSHLSGSSPVQSKLGLTIRLHVCMLLIQGGIPQANSIPTTIKPFLLDKSIKEPSKTLHVGSIGNERGYHGNKTRKIEKREIPMRDYTLIETCISNRCLTLQCTRPPNATLLSKNDPTHCNMGLNLDKPSVHCSEDYCIAFCEGKFCTAKCTGKYCEAKCRGDGCKANCEGLNCKMENGTAVKRLIRFGDRTYPTVKLAATKTRSVSIRT